MSLFYVTKLKKIIRVNVKISRKLSNAQSRYKIVKIVINIQICNHLLHLPMLAWKYSNCLLLSHIYTTCVLSCSVVSDSLQQHEPQPARLLCPWDFLGKNNGAGCHFLLPNASCYPAAAAAAAKLLPSCPTLCNPIDGSPPGSPVPGILQARTLEWAAISFSNAWKWKVKGKSLSRVRLFVTPWTAAYQAPPSMGFSRQKYWSGVPSPSLTCYPT